MWGGIAPVHECLMLDTLLCGMSVWACTICTPGDHRNSPGGRSDKHSAPLPGNKRLVNPPTEAALVDELLYVWPTLAPPRTASLTSVSEEAQGSCRCICACSRGLSERA